MPYVSQTYIVLIASPSDLPEERQAAKQAVHDWNALNAKAEGVTLDPHMWETHATPGFGRPQDVINEQLVKDADLLIGMFWTKIGTATGAAVSGTAEEIDQIVAAGKPAMLYFSNRPIDPAKVDLEQMKGLKAFQKETYAKALVGSFTSPDDLRNKLKDDLTRRVREMKKAHVVPHAPAREADVEDAAARKRAEEKWTEFDKKMGLGQFRDLWSARVQVTGPGLPPVSSYAHIYLSIIPLKPVSPPLDIGVIDQKTPHGLKPMGSSGWNNDLYGRSLVLHDGRRRRDNRAAERPDSVTELTDDGCLFAATSMGVGTRNDGKDVIVLEGPERQVLSYLPTYVKTLRGLGVAGPLEVRVGLMGMYLMNIQPDRSILWDTRQFRPLTERKYALGPVTVTEDMDDAAIQSALCPEFTRVWRDGGVPRDPCFDPTTGKLKV